MNHYFCFSWIGLIVFLLPMITNVFYFLIQVTEVSENKVKGHLLLDILEHESVKIEHIFVLLELTKNLEDLA